MKSLILNRVENIRFNPWIGPAEKNSMIDKYMFIYEMYTEKTVNFIDCLMMIIKISVDNK